MNYIESKKEVVYGCRQLQEYFIDNSISNLNGDNPDYVYYIDENGVWQALHSDMLKKSTIDDVPFSYYISRHIHRQSDKYKSVNSTCSSNKYKEEESKENIKSKLKEVLNVQIGGSHYQGNAIQPIEYIMANNLNFPEGCVVKYISRHRRKNGKEDLLKVIQNVQMILADEYGVVVEFNVKEND